MLYEIQEGGTPLKLLLDSLLVMDKWAYERGVELDFSRPGKPTDNERVDGFNGRLRLNANWFLSLDDAEGQDQCLADVLQRESPPLRARLGNANQVRPSMRPAGRIDDP